MAITDESIDTKRARLRKEKAERDEAAKEEREAAEVEGLELESKYSAELGRLGVDFAMVDASAFGDGFIVVKLGADLPFKAYVDAVSTAKGAPDPADVFAFAAPAVVHPTQERFAEIVRKRSRLLGRTADALASLHGVKSKEIEGKF